MKKLLILSAVFFLMMTTAGTAAADQYIMDTSDPLYDINYATRMVDGTGTIPEGDDPDPSDGYYYSSWQDENDLSDPGIFALGKSDFVYGDPDGVYECWGGATGFSGKCASDNWMVLGFDQALSNHAGNDMIVSQFGWGDTGEEMEIFVSTDATYSSIAEMTWVSLGYLDNTSKPFTWGDYGTSPYMTFDFSDYAGITGDVNYVMFEGNSHWVDAVGAVPIPGAVWLLGSGLLALVGIRRRS